MAAEKDVNPDVFVTVWSDLIRFALDEQGWDARGDFRSNADDVIHELLGFDMGKAAIGNDARYMPLMQGMTQIFEEAAARWFVFGKVAAGFCRFSLRPIGADLLRQGVRWLAAAEPDWSEWCWEHDGLAEDLVNFLRAALDRHRKAIAAHAESLAAFSHICNVLVAKGYPAAMALRDRIVTS